MKTLVTRWWLRLYVSVTLFLYWLLCSPVADADTYQCRNPAYANTHKAECFAAPLDPFGGAVPPSNGPPGSGGLLGGLLHSLGL